MVMINTLSNDNISKLQNDMMDFGAAVQSHRHAENPIENLKRSNSITSLADSVIKKAAKYTDVDKSVSSDADNSLSFDLWLSDGRQIMAELTPSGEFDVRVYNDGELIDHYPFFSAYSGSGDEENPDNWIALLEGRYREKWETS